ncbi:MAG: PEP-CTERM sorting domain-containing protein [Planctomycetota bacterium]|nr:MAG: PEP-CTERM sorting domain-containing protein [Planctomycetota bacterium]
MRSTTRRALLTAVVLAATAGYYVATASYVGAGTLPVDPNALPGFQGTANFNGTVGTAILDANVEFAVYEPGNFALTFPALDDPSGGTEYVYAYQVYNNGVTANTRVQELSIFLEPNLNPVTATGDTPDGGLLPNLVQIPIGGTGQSNVKWTWLSPLFNVGLFSEIVLFTSPLEPHYVLSSVKGGSTTIASNALPSPVPEPSTLALVLTAAVACLGGAWVRKRRS